VGLRLGRRLAVHRPDALRADDDPQLAQGLSRAVRSTARAALRPHRPCTPPPGWDAAPHIHSPRTGSAYGDHPPPAGRRPAGPAPRTPRRRRRRPGSGRAARGRPAARRSCRRPARAAPARAPRAGRAPARRSRAPSHRPPPPDAPGSGTRPTGRRRRAAPGSGPRGPAGRR
jgi:hypothetical protein